MSALSFARSLSVCPAFTSICASPSRSAPRALQPLAQVLEPRRTDAVRLPVPVVEMPPLVDIDRETRLLHHVTQQLPVCALLGGTSRVLRMGALGKLVIAARHRRWPPGPELIERQVDGAAAIVPRT